MFSLTTTSTEQKTQDYNPVDGYVAEVATTACDSTAELLGDAIAHVKLSLVSNRVSNLLQ